MTEINLPPLDLNNPDDLKTAIITMNSNMNGLDKKLDDIKTEISDMKKAANRWLPKTLWGWVLLVTFVGGLLWGAYEMMNLKDHQQDIKIQSIDHKVDTILQHVKK